MGNLHYVTRHAAIRQHQRAITDDMVDLLHLYGDVHVHRGAEVYSFNKPCWKRLVRDAPCPPQVLDRLKSCYLVECNGKLVTVGHRRYRFKRDVK